jgi:hypothetical protein
VDPWSENLCAGAGKTARLDADGTSLSARKPWRQLLGRLSFLFDFATLCYTRARGEFERLCGLSRSAIFVFLRFDL